MAVFTLQNGLSHVR